MCSWQMWPAHASSVLSICNATTAPDAAVSNIVSNTPLLDCVWSHLYGPIFSFSPTAAPSLGSAPFVCIKLFQGLELSALLAEAAVNPIDLC